MVDDPVAGVPASTRTPPVASTPLDVSGDEPISPLREPVPPTLPLIEPGAVGKEGETLVVPLVPLPIAPEGVVGTPTASLDDDVVPEADVPLCTFPEPL